MRLQQRAGVEHGQEQRQTPQRGVGDASAVEKEEHGDAQEHEHGERALRFQLALQPLGNQRYTEIEEREDAVKGEQSHRG